MGLNYEGATYYLSSGVNILFFRCKHLKHGCKGLVKFRDLQRNSRVPDTNRLMQFRAHNVHCEFYVTNFSLRKICKNELDPNPQARGPSKKLKWISTEILNSSELGNVEAAEIDANHVTWSTREFEQFEGDQSSEEDCILIEEDETERIASGEEQFNLNGGTVTSGATHSIGSVDGSESDAEQARDDRVRKSKISELDEMISQADKNLKHLENCLRDFVDTCDYLRAAENDQKQATEQDERRETAVCIQID